MQKHEGIVKKVIHRNQDNDYTILDLEEGNVLIRVGGYFPGVFTGSFLSVTGEYEENTNNGFSFSPYCWKTELPLQKYEMINFLKDLVVDEYVKDETDSDNPFGESPVISEIEYRMELIYRKYQEQTYKVIVNEPDAIRYIHPSLDRGGKYSKIPLLLNIYIEEIQYKLLFTEAIVEVDAQLAQYSSRMISAINEITELREAGDPLFYLKNHPFIFCDILEDDGFKFPDADKIAKHYDLPMDSYERCKAGIKYAYKGYKDSIFSKGHVYALPQQLMETSTAILSLEQHVLSQRIEEMIDEGMLIRDTFVEEGIYLADYFYMEYEIADKLMEMNNRNQSNIEILPNYDAINMYLGFELDDQQKDAITTAINSPITIITGGPGTGKTTIIRGLIAALQAEGITEISLAAPTGKAALRMQEATKLKAQTIHRLLKITPKSDREEVREISEDVVILDEFSMVDIDLMDKLVHALDLHVKLVFIGDVNQLPSVGPGYILHDLIESGQFSVVRLTQVHRQAENSSIVRNARRVLNREMIEVDYSDSTDLIFEQADSLPDIEEAICRIVLSILNNDKEVKMEDIQVLSPRKGDLAGTESLNHKLQDALNPETDSFETIEGEKIRTNDRIMLTKNDYSINVFNGEISKECFVNYDEQSQIHSLALEFDGERRAEYQERATSTKYLELAYAITVHKSQGSEYKYVIMPVFHSKGLYCNLIYTAMTRAKGKLYFVGSREALKEGINDVRPVERNTKLKERIRVYGV